MRDEALPCADIITPNLFEVEQLTGHTCATLDGVKQAIRELQALGPRTVLLTSVRTSDTPDDALDMAWAADRNSIACARRCCRSR